MRNGLLAIGLGAVAVLAGGGAQAQCARGCVAIENVAVISMAPGAEVDAASSVLIEGDRIVAVGAADAVEIPAGTRIVDGTGKWLIPGLADMHMHFFSEPIDELGFSPEQILSPYIAHGVLQVADLAASTYSNDIRDAVNAGDMTAPMMVTAAMVDGVPAIRPGAREIADAEAAQGVVEKIAA